MPELPEVETILRGIKTHLEERKIIKTVIRRPTLRWPIPANLDSLLRGQIILSITRRAKYLLFHFTHGSMLLHLGMSGRLCIMPESIPHQKHDHVDLCLDNETCLRFTDPRRFGAILWTEDEPALHPLLKNIGPEPLSQGLNGSYLYKVANKKKVPVKTLIMDSNVVAGVGNIYAAESLFLAGIHPLQLTNTISLERYTALAQAIKKVLRHAIQKGGTTLKDYVNANGAPGYFRIELNVYGRSNEACVKCGKTLSEAKIGQRSTVFCNHCQKLSAKRLL